MTRPLPADVRMFLDFVETNRRQGREEWEARQKAIGFKASTVSATVRTVDSEGRVRRETLRDPQAIVAAYQEQLHPPGFEPGGGSKKSKRKRERVYPKPTVWAWDEG